MSSILAELKTTHYLANACNDQTKSIDGLIRMSLNG